MTAKNILELNGKDLEKELDRIALENPPRNKCWTQKEEEVFQKLRSRKVPQKKIAAILGRTLSSVQNYSMRQQ